MILGRTPDGSLHEGALAALLGYRLAQAAVITSAVFDQQMSDALALKPVEFSALALIHGNPGAGPAQLAQALSISRPLITQCLDRLESRGLVQRTPKPSDGRGLEVNCTGAGRRAVTDALRRLADAEAQALAGLSRAEQGMLLELLGKAARRPA
ncbi:MAG: MarR family transcriptional regulator [Rubrivivax sp.]|nr:MarR family transcriptional regulator [Rubrivivax sp.]